MPAREGAAKLSKKSEKQPKFSIVTYLVILFVLVIALVLLSYFVERSRDSDALALFRSEHMTRLSQIEQRIDALEEALAAAAQAFDTGQVQLKAEADAAEYMTDTALAQQAQEIETLRAQLDALQREIEQILEENGNKG